MCTIVVPVVGAIGKVLYLFTQYSFCKAVRGDGMFWLYFLGSSTFRVDFSLIGMPVQRVLLT